MAGYILNLMDEISKGIFTEINKEKSIFHFEKQNLKPIGNFMHTTGYLAFGKALLSKLYLKVKVYITKLLSIIY